MADNDPNDFNQQVINEFRANAGVVGGYFEGVTVLLLTTTGAKSGNPTTTPLVYIPDGDKMAIIASQGGAPKNPAWYYNLKANPTATIEVGSEKLTVTAEEVKGQARDDYYTRAKGILASFNDYETMTTRTIPVMVLSKA